MLVIFLFFLFFLYFFFICSSKRNQGKEYNHSTFCDLIISWLIGLGPSNDTTFFYVHPLVDLKLVDYFTLDTCFIIPGIFPFSLIKLVCCVCVGVSVFGMFGVFDVFGVLGVCDV
jgi:hypothetical protein